MVELRLGETISGLFTLWNKVKGGGIPVNEDWVKAAIPLNSIMNILLNYEKVKDEEFVDRGF